MSNKFIKTHVRRIPVIHISDALVDVVLILIRIVLNTGLDVRRILHEHRAFMVRAGVRIGKMVMERIMKAIGIHYQRRLRFRRIWEIASRFPNTPRHSEH